LRWGEKLKSAGLQKWCGMLVARALKNRQLTWGERHAASKKDGARCLVERLWPRGMKK
jgi:hypothetical protein